MRNTKLDILFEPLEMPNLTLKNRFFMAPLGTTFTLAQWTDFLVARARGGVALITGGQTSVHSSGRSGGERELRLESDEDIKTLIPAVRAVHKAGAKMVAQLNHLGRYAFSRALGHQAVAPSAVASRFTGETPRELSTQEVDELVLAFAKAAVRAREAGFDGIELLGSSGYLISQFLSPLTNKREDKYGGDPLGRGTFLFSILRETRARVGEDFNICVKFDAEDGMKGGKTLEDSLLLAPEMVSAGADRLHVWAGWHEAERPMLPMFVSRGAFSALAGAIKKVVDVPVSTVGRINDPDVAADILTRREADLVGLGRALMCDPDFVKKTMEGRVDEIRRCIACCYCFDQIMGLIKGKDSKKGLACALNPELGHEGEGLIRPSPQERHVVVVGGGPAGAEAARVAALRGHRVTLFEKAPKLGGMVNLATVPPHKGELQNVVDYYMGQLENLRVDVRLGQSFTPEVFAEVCPDVVVLAAGADALEPDIAGIRENQVHTALEVLEKKVEVGEKVVVIGGGLIGVETAEYLADQGKKVILVERLNAVAADVGFTTRWGLLPRIRKKMQIHTSNRVTEVKEGRVILVDSKGDRREMAADTIVLAAGLRSRVDLVDFLKESGVEYYVVGSCRTPGQIAAAVRDGFEIGCRV